MKTATKKYTIKPELKKQYPIAVFPIIPDNPKKRILLKVPPASEQRSDINALECARDYFPGYSDSELDNIIYGETGFPSFWNIPADGATPEECFRKQLLNAVARRNIRYSNLEIVEVDPYAGTVGELNVKDTTFGDIKINLPDGYQVTYDSDDGNISVHKSDKILHKGKILPLTKQHAMPVLPELNKYIMASDVLEKFIQENGQISQEEFMKLDMGTFINWLVATALKEEEENGR